MSEEVEFPTRRDIFKVVGGGLGLGILGGGTGVAAGKLVLKPREEFKERAEEPLEEAIADLTPPTQDYIAFNTSVNDLNAEIDGSDRRVYLGVGIESNETDPDDIDEVLADDPYLDEGSEIFDTYASIMAESELADSTRIELGYESGVLQSASVSGTDLGTIRDSDLDQLYREELVPNVS